MCSVGKGKGENEGKVAAIENYKVVGIEQMGMLRTVVQEMEQQQIYMHDPRTRTKGGHCQREWGVLGGGEQRGKIGTTVLA